MQWRRNCSGRSGFGRYTFSPKISVHKLLIARQPLCCSSLGCYMRVFALKVHCHCQNLAGGTALAQGYNEH